MGIDMSKMKARREALQNRGAGGGNKEMFWRPQDGETTIRIVPTDDGDPFKDYWFHYNVGNNPGFLSPKKNFGEEDPLDNFVRSLFKEGSDDSIKMAKSLMARQRFFAPVLVRGEEDKGVRVWGFGKMAYQELLNLVLNPDYGDITDTDEGTDLVITYGKPPGAQFPQTTITPRRRPSPLSKNKKDVKTYLEQVPDFTSLFEKKSPTQVQGMLDEFLLGEENAEEASTEKSKYKTSSDTATSVDDAFAEFLG
tara:strand:- start:1422 stop:2177 length:756 start_codon:yes stop_codon:yes gene_type:complete